MKNRWMLIILSIPEYIYIGVQIIKLKILQIENLTTFYTSGGNRA